LPIVVFAEFLAHPWTECRFGLAKINSERFAKCNVNEKPHGRQYWIIRYFECSGGLFNVGGGMVRSVWLRELTSMSQKIFGRKIDIGHVAETRDADNPFCVGDHQAVTRTTGWMPKRSLDQLLEDVRRWLVDEQAQLESVLSQ
jgi:nucleoside-diphosphate-sugar epimerase